MSNVSQWAVADSDNDQTPPNGWPEGMQRSSVNDSARADKGGVARWYQDTNGSLVSTGTGAAYTLTTNNNHQALADQSILVFQANVVSGAAPTLDVDTLGAKEIKTGGGETLPAGAIQADQIAVVAYNATDDVYNLIGGSFAALAEGAKVLPSKYRSSYSLTRTATQQVAIGAFAVRDDTDTVSLVRTGSLTKSIGSSWAVGNAGGLDTGTVANLTWYHVWGIRRSDTGVVDALFSLSPTSPTLPANYDSKAWLGAVRTGGSADIQEFEYDRGSGTFWLRTPIEDYNNSNDISGGTTLTLTSVPNGFESEVMLGVHISRSEASSIQIQIRHPALTDFGNVWDLGSGQPGSTGGGGSNADGQVRALTNTARQVFIRTNVNPTSVIIEGRAWRRADI